MGRGSIGWARGQFWLFHFQKSDLKSTRVRDGVGGPGVVSGR